ncbi:uncharacterized protein LOC110377747 [Helicoverpa armigera]|uniref:uncharacterized protein LOC110377747 n=1 Tax=Helicoverpa armigera TaxID=29058 RepID=UPI0030836887
MNWHQCFFVFFFGILIINVSEFSCTDPPQGAIPVPFKFGYNANEKLNVLITLKNIPSSITYINMRTKMFNLQELSHETVPADHVLTVTKTLALKRSKMSIQAEIYDPTGLCEKKIIVEGKEVNSSQGNPDYSYNNICLQQQSCSIEVDLSKACSGEQSL